MVLAKTNKTVTNINNSDDDDDGDDDKNKNRSARNQSPQHRSRLVAVDQQENTAVR